MLRNMCKKIIMTKGDFGIILPIKITGLELSELDNIKITIKKDIDTNSIIEKNYNSNLIDFSLTKTESEKLLSGEYFYSIDYYRNNQFMCNIIKKESFIVEDKI